MTTADIDRSQKVLTGIMLIAVFLAVLILVVTIVYSTMDDAYQSYEGEIYEEHSVINETGAYINSTGYTVAETDADYYDYTITAAYNDTDGTLIGSGNYSITDDGVVYNETATTWDNVSLSYDYKEDTSEDTTVSNTYSSVENNLLTMIGNFFSLMPTIGTILAVVILIAAIVILVLYVSRMRQSGQPGASSFAG